MPGAPRFPARRDLWPVAPVGEGERCPPRSALQQDRQDKTGSRIPVPVMDGISRACGRPRPPRRDAPPVHWNRTAVSAPHSTIFRFCLHRGPVHASALPARAFWNGRRIGDAAASPRKCACRPYRRRRGRVPLPGHFMGLQRRERRASCRWRTLPVTIKDLSPLMQYMIQ